SGEEYVYYHPECKECTIKASGQWQKDNPERYLDNVKRFYSTPKGKKSKAKESNKLVKEGKQMDWQRRNKEKIKEYNKIRQSKKHDISNKEWLECKNYFSNKCAYCGLHVDDHFTQWKGGYRKIDLHKEHVVHDGDNDLSNCIPACQSCNSSKSTYTIDEWYNEDNENFSKERLHKIHKWLKEDYKLYIQVKQ
ncbi:HNH endonuclease, partial [Butyricicoccus sp. 1XD8-22]